MFKGWTALIDTSKLGGWVRALAAAGVAAALAKAPGLAAWIDPATQGAISALVSALVVGVWSHVAKKIDS